MYPDANPSRMLTSEVTFHDTSLSPSPVGHMMMCVSVFLLTLKSLVLSSPG